MEKNRNKQKSEKANRWDELNDFYVTKPLSGQGKEIRYRKVPEGYDVLWGKTEFLISKEIVDQLLEDFFKNDEWKVLGVSMDNPISGGMGEYIASKEKAFTPRHASAIAAILVKEGFLIDRNKKPILLKKITKSH